MFGWFLGGGGGGNWGGGGSGGGGGSNFGSSYGNNYGGGAMRGNDNYSQRSSGPYSKHPVSGTIGSISNQYCLTSVQTAWGCQLVIAS